MLQNLESGTLTVVLFETYERDADGGIVRLIASLPIQALLEAAAANEEIAAYTDPRVASVDMQDMLFGAYFSVLDDELLVTYADGDFFDKVVRPLTIGEGTLEVGPIEPLTRYGLWAVGLGDRRVMLAHSTGVLYGRVNLP